MGVEGAPEGPEDPIAQICVTLGTVRVFRFSKHTRDTRQKRILFFFPFIVLEVFSSIVVVQITQPPRRRRRSLGDSSFTLLLVYSLYIYIYMSTIPCLFRGGHDVVRVFLTFLFISLMLCDDKHAGVRDGNVNRGDERCLQSCEMARLLQVRRVQRDEV